MLELVPVKDNERSMQQVATQSEIENSNWNIEILGVLCDIQIGKTPLRAQRKYWGDGYPWLSIADMNQGREIWSTKEQITEQAIRECNCKLVSSGTVLMSFKLSIGKIGFARRPMYTNEAIAALSIIKPNLVIPEYLYWVLQHLDLVEGADTAAKGNTLNKAKLDKLQIPLPPLVEQRRIAAILDKADDLRRKRQQAITKLDALLQSVFLEMFVTSRLDEYPITSIADILKSEKNAIRTGPFGSQLLHAEFVNSGIAVLGIDNAVQNTFAWGERRYITEKKFEQLRRYQVFPGDVIITIMGTCGRCAIVPDNIPTAINTKHLCCITLDQEKCLPVFLHSCFLKHPDIKRQLRDTTKGAIMDGLNMGIIKDLKFPLPPLTVQEEYVAIVERIEAQKASYMLSYKQAQNLFSSLQNQAFQGANVMKKTTSERPRLTLDL